MGVYIFKPQPGIRGSIPGSTLAGLCSLGGPGETRRQQKKTQKTVPPLKNLVGIPFSVPNGTGPSYVKHPVHLLWSAVEKKGPPLYRRLYPQGEGDPPCNRVCTCAVVGACRKEYTPL